MQTCALPIEPHSQPWTPRLATAEGCIAFYSGQAKNTAELNPGSRPGTHQEDYMAIVLGPAPKLLIVMVDEGLFLEQSWPPSLSVFVSPYL